MAAEQSHRLYVKARHTGYQRGKHTQKPTVSLLRLDGVDSAEEAEFYLGKKAAFIYRANKDVRGSKLRVIWGKIRSTHGNSGVVRASFNHNLPPRSFGQSVRVMMYPSAI